MQPKVIACVIIYRKVLREASSGGRDVERVKLKRCRKSELKRGAEKVKLETRTKLR